MMNDVLLIQPIDFSLKFCRTFRHCVDDLKSKLKGNNFCSCVPGLKTDAEFFNHNSFFMQIKGLQGIQVIWSQKSWMKRIK